MVFRTRSGSAYPAHPRFAVMYTTAARRDGRSFSLSGVIRTARHVPQAKACSSSPVAYRNSGLRQGRRVSGRHGARHGAMPTGDGLRCTGRRAPTKIEKHGETIGTSN